MTTTITAMPRYESYKDSGVAWLGYIPEHWCEQRLKNVVSNCENGIWGDEPKGNNDTIVIRVADFDRDKLCVSLNKLTRRFISQKDLSERQLKHGDLLIEKSGGGDKTLVGCVVLFNHSLSAVTSNFVAKITLCPDYDYLFLKYVFHSLYINKINYKSIKQTTGIQNLDIQNYLDERFAFPPKNEQQAIARFLDQKTAQIDQAIAIKQRQIALLKERKQIIIQNAVTKGLNPDAPMKASGVDWIGDIPAHWEVKRLKHCLKISNGQDYKDVVAENGQYPVFGSGGEFAKAAAYLYEGEAILMGRKGTIDNPLYVNCAFWAVDTMFYAIPNGIYNSKFLYLSVTQIPFSYYSTSTALPSMTQFSLNNNPIAIPTLNEQTDIARHIETESNKIESTISIHQTQIHKLQEYKATLINSAVTGKIKIS